jgi:TatD DNase family protein
MDKPVFIDVHCHIDVYKDIKKIVERALKNGVEIIINNGMTPEINRKTLEMSRKFPNIKPALGIYTNECLDMSEDAIEEEISFIRENSDKIIAIGEVGIDLKESSDFKTQKEIFEKFIDLAIELDKPIIVHSRKAEDKVIDILEKNGIKKVIMHCFSGDLKLVKRIIDNKWCLSIPTNITFSEHFQKVVEITPIEQLFCETDSPFLHPEKNNKNNQKLKAKSYLIPDLDFWNKQQEGNQPANVIESYKKIAEIKKMDLDDVKTVISENFLRVFMGE